MEMDKEWLEENKRRSENMERWYHLDNRHLKSHKMHGLFTGLGAIGPKLDKKDELTKRMSKAYDRLRSH